MRYRADSFCSKRQRSWKRRPGFLTGRQANPGILLSPEKPHRAEPRSKLPLCHMQPGMPHLPTFLLVPLWWLGARKVCGGPPRYSVDQKIRVSKMSLRTSKLLGTCPPDIDSSEEKLDRSVSVKLSQLRSGYSTILNSYNSRIDKNIVDKCSDCQATGHTTDHLFN